MKQKLLILFLAVCCAPALALTPPPVPKKKAMVSNTQKQKRDAAVEAGLCPDSNHPHTIDLGLPSRTKWACCNVGASSPTDYGGYYAWGETETKSDYSTDTYAYYRNGHYVVIAPDISGTEYDVAAAKWGGSWKMPNIKQCEELEKYCDYQWTTRKGVEGALFCSPNGKAVFLPAAGLRMGPCGSAGCAAYVGIIGCCWISTPNPAFSNDAYYLRFDLTCPVWNHRLNREYGLTIRPVAE